MYVHYLSICIDQHLRQFQKDPFPSNLPIDSQAIQMQNLSLPCLGLLSCATRDNGDTQPTRPISSPLVTHAHPPKTAQATGSTADSPPPPSTDVMCSVVVLLRLGSASFSFFPSLAFPPSLLKRTRTWLAGKHHGPDNYRVIRKRANHLIAFTSTRELSPPFGCGCPNTAAALRTKIQEKRTITTKALPPLLPPLPPLPPTADARSEAWIDPS